jgi:hypothetical protein
MSLELRDLRAKVTVETDAVLLVESRITGKDRSEIVRDILSEWAEQRVHAAKLLVAMLERDGLLGVGEGTLGSARERFTERDTGDPDRR